MTSTIKRQGNIPVTFTPETGTGFYVIKNTLEIISSNQIIGALEIRNDGGQQFTPNTWKVLGYLSSPLRNVFQGMAVNGANGEYAGMIEINAAGKVQVYTKVSFSSTNSSIIMNVMARARI